MDNNKYYDDQDSRLQSDRWGPGVPSEEERTEGSNPLIVANERISQTPVSLDYSLASNIQGPSVYQSEVGSGLRLGTEMLNNEISDDSSLLLRHQLWTSANGRCMMFL